MTNSDVKRARGTDSPGIPNRKEPVYEGDWALHPNILSGKWTYTPLLNSPYFDGMVTTASDVFFVSSATPASHKLDRARKYLDRRQEDALNRVAGAQRLGVESEGELQELVDQRKAVLTQGLKNLGPASSDNEYRKVIEDAGKLEALGEDVDLKEIEDKYKEKVEKLAGHPERVPTSSNQKLLAQRLAQLQLSGGDLPQLADSLTEPIDPEKQKSIDRQASEFESQVRRSYRPISPRHLEIARKKPAPSNGTEDKGISDRGTRSLTVPKIPEELKSFDRQASEFESQVRRSYRPISPRHLETAKRKSTPSDGTEDKGISERGITKGRK